MTKKPTTEEQTEKIISIVKSEVRQDLVILIIPSHNKENKALNNQEMWADSALDLFADLYGGATAFHTFKGIYKDNDGKVYQDKPILIECYVDRGRLIDVVRLQQLVDFAKRMGREARQKAVALIINDIFHEISDY